ncbi:ExbD/TolR family protein [Acanthopleuribacter pedis]|uniref:Biopolymer transporter ExbD n=1 Tax=Acanthopleuribacter pedis TaxID=442870 RepID=A0A8J7U4N3_9BACT|nr:biopolymer transporter ExbD [Acanthopleuribacter pedis]MBO1321663.1 biopolymer transporter ExbD [Acanthopleuribacter pedis]
MLYRRDRKKQSILVDLSPLIDVVFLLLIFFMVSTRFRDDHGLDLNLPQSESRQASQEQSLTIVVGADSSIRVDGETVARDQLEPTLKAKLESREKKMVVMRIDQSVAHGTVVEVMDAAKKAGASGLSYATSGPGKR